MYVIDNEDESYDLYQKIEKRKKKILRDAIEDAENEEAERFAKEQEEIYRIKLRPKLF